MKKKMKVGKLIESTERRMARKTTDQEGEGGIAASLYRTRLRKTVSYRSERLQLRVTSGVEF